MRNFTIFSLFIVSAYFSIPQYAFAHVLKSDGSIGAVMHVSPEDDPVAGVESGFFFEFKDKNNSFDPTRCECTFTVLQNETEVFSQPLFQNNAKPSLSSASIFYTFPKRGVYTIRLTGQPLSDKMFEPFTLSYDIRVERTSDAKPLASESNWFTDHIPHFIGGLVGFSALVFIMFKSGRKKEGS